MGRTIVNSNITPLHQHNICAPEGYGKMCSVCVHERDTYSHISYFTAMFKSQRM